MGRRSPNCVPSQRSLARATLGLYLLDRFLNQARIGEIIFATNIDKGASSPEWQRRWEDDLDQLVRVIIHDHAILKGARLRLISNHRGQRG